MNQTTATTTAEAVEAILGQTAYAVGSKQVKIKVDKQEQRPKRVSKHYKPTRTVNIRLAQSTYDMLQRRLAMLFLTTGEKTTVSRYIGNLIAEDLAQHADDLESLRGVHEPQ